MTSPIKVAVLDDYQDFAAPIFQKLDAGKFQVTIFRDTLLPYNHPDTPQDEKNKLVARLEPFQVICKPLSPRLLFTVPQPYTLLTTIPKARCVSAPRSPAS